jgi:hypothetical protein
MDDKGIRPGVWIAVGGGLALVGLLVFMLRSGRDASTDQPPDAIEEKVVSARPAAPPPPSRRQERGASEPAPAEEVPYIEGLVYGDIDLREAKTLMPDNIYWQQGAPTKDPDELARREAEKKKRNEEYGRVLAGDASEDEVRSYYDYKKKVSEDYLEFSEFMARRYRSSDHKEMVGLLDMATKMHAEKLSQLPAELEDALARAKEREKVREDWRRQQEEFGEFPREPTLDEQAGE